MLLLRTSGDMPIMKNDGGFRDGDCHVSAEILGGLFDD